MIDGCDTARVVHQRISNTYRRIMMASCCDMRPRSPGMQSSMFDNYPEPIDLGCWSPLIRGREARWGGQMRESNPSRFSAGVLQPGEGRTRTALVAGR